MEGRRYVLLFIEIYELKGQKVMTLNSNFSSIDISNLSSGLYLVKLSLVNSFKILKLIKE